MNQKELLRNVARRTGETVNTIKHLGFNLEPDSVERHDEANYFDWDEMETVPVSAIGDPAIACLF